MKTFTQVTFAAMLLFAICLSARAQSPALKFNNTDNVINFDQKSLIEDNANYTIEMWLKAENGGNGNGDQIYCEGSATSNSNMIRMYSASGKLTFRTYFNTTDARFSSDVIFDTPAVWYHVAVVGTTPGGAGTETTVEMFVDGVSVGSGTYIKPTSARLTRTTIGDLTRTSNQGGIYAYNGEIDELRLWSRALTATEIASNACEIVDNTGLVSHFRFNEASGTTTKDEVSGNSATIEGTAPAWTTNDNCTATTIPTELDESTLRMYPNPATSMVYFSSESTKSEIIEVCIFNTTGAMIFSQKSDTDINVEAFSKGMYFVNITMNNGLTTTKKLIIN